MKRGDVSLSEAMVLVSSVKNLRDELLRALPGETPRLYGRLWEFKRPYGGLTRLETGGGPFSATVVLRRFVESGLVVAERTSQIVVSMQDVDSAAEKLALDGRRHPDDQEVSRAESPSRG